MLSLVANSQAFTGLAGAGAFAGVLGKLSSIVEYVTSAIAKFSALFTSPANLAGKFTSFASAAGNQLSASAGISASSASGEISFFQAVSRAFGVLGMGTNTLRLLGGLWTTVWIALVSVAFSIILGFLFGMLMTVKKRPVQIICRIYLEFMRIMPQMVLLFVAYYGLTRMFNISLSGEAASILVFTLWGTAEMGDLVRGALESVPKHQYESGRAIGLTERQIFLYIVIPQTLRLLIPLSMNLITRMIKTTSLVVFVGVIEVVKIGQQIIEANRLTVPTASIAVYFVIFMMYFFVCWILSLAARFIEKKQKL